MEHVLIYRQFSDCFGLVFSKPKKLHFVVVFFNIFRGNFTRPL
jgi:hypothetical protein